MAFELKSQQVDERDLGLVRDDHLSEGAAPSCSGRHKKARSRAEGVKGTAEVRPRAIGHVVVIHRSNYLSSATK